MLAVARASIPHAETAAPVLLVHADGAALPFRSAFDAVFSAATLHSITDHQAVFESVAAALDAGGRFVAQCGGRGNLQRMLEHTSQLQASATYREYLHDWRDPWNFAGPAETATRLRAAGLRDEEAWLEEAPVNLETAEKYADFVSCVCIRHHVERLPLQLRDRFTQDLTALAARDAQPYTLDYWRLNIDARKARGSSRTTKNGPPRTPGALKWNAGCRSASPDGGWRRSSPALPVSRDPCSRARRFPLPCSPPG